MFWGAVNTKIEKKILLGKKGAPGRPSASVKAECMYQ